MTDPLVALRERIDLIWQNHEREHRQHEAAHAREHAFSQRAIDTAAEMAKENKADANEWRATMDDRERNFATKADVRSIAEQIDKLEAAEIRRVEREGARVISEQGDRRDAEVRQARSLWAVGLIVGLIASVGAILFSTMLRLVFP